MPTTIHAKFLCPNCLKPAEKDGPLQLLLSNLSDADNLSFANPKILPAPLRRMRQCPACGGEIDLHALVQRKLDYHGWGWRAGLLGGAIAAGLAYAGGVDHLGSPYLVASACIVAITGLTAWFAVDMVERSRIARFRKTID